MKSNVHVILYQDEYSDVQSILASLQAIIKSEQALSVSVLADALPVSVQEMCGTLGRESGIPEIRFVELQSLPWYYAVNECAIDEQYLLFLAAGAVLKDDCLERLVRAFASGRNAGVNPLLLDRAESKVTHLGYVADSQMRLHSLYEGISPANPLVSKVREFQLAHPAAFLVHGKDFKAAGGFIPERMQLAFFDFCRRLIAKKGRGVATVAEAAAIYENHFADAGVSGLWNSLVMRGKLVPGTLLADYYTNVRADGLNYEITGWLAETCENAGVWDEADPWLAWRHSPDPASLLRWLSSLPDTLLAPALKLIREFPSHLPVQFRYYETLAESLANFADKNQIESMKAQVCAWQKSARSFHYGQLRKGMEALKAAGVYNASFDDCAASYEAWLELSPNAQISRITPGREWPRIAIAMPTYNPDPPFLRSAIDSIRAQLYSGWQLCIADDASPNQEIRDIL